MKNTVSKTKISLDKLNTMLEIKVSDLKIIPSKLYNVENKEKKNGRKKKKHQSLSD